MNPETHDTDCGEGAAAFAGQRLPSAGSLILLVPRLLAASLHSATHVIGKTLDGSFNRCSEEHCCHQGDPDCCHIPETSCPSPCVGDICWSGCAGDRSGYRLQVTNTGDVEREFRFSAEPFPCTEQRITLSMESKTLAPGESVLLDVGFTIPNEFGGGIYSARLYITGAYEQYLWVTLNVRTQQDCCGHIEQGEIPRQIKASHWFRHFQHEQPCFPDASEARRT